MIVLTDNNFGRHLYLPVKPSGLVTEYGFNCLPFDIMSNNVRMSPASNKTAGSLLGSFHKSYLTSSQRNVSHLQPMATSASLVNTMYSGGQYHGVDAYTDRYSIAYTISTSRAGDIFDYAAPSLTMGPLYITDSNYSPGSHGTSYYANFEHQYCYALRCNIFYHMTVDHLSSYYVLLVKGTKSEIMNNGFGFTQIITSGSFTANYDPDTATLTAPISADYFQSSPDPVTKIDTYKGIYCDVRPLYTVTIGGDSYCVISVTRLFYNDYLAQNVQWIAMPYVCHEFSSVYVIYAGMEIYGSVQMN